MKSRLLSTVSAPVKAPVTNETVSGSAPPANAVFTVEALDAEKSEGDTGNTTFTFRVTRSVNTTGEKTVDYSISEDGDLDASDFGGALPTGTVTFSDAESTKTVEIDVSGDTTHEDDETFSLVLASPSEGAELGSPSSADGIIQNDDRSTVAQVGSWTYAAGDIGTFTAGAGTDRIILIPVFIEQASAPDPSSVQYGDQTATLRVSNQHSGGNWRTAWYTISEAQIQAATGNGITVSGITNNYAVCAAVLQNVDQTTPIHATDDYVSGSGGNDTVSLTAPITDLIVLGAQSNRDTNTANWTGPTVQLAEQRGASQTVSIATDPGNGASQDYTQNWSGTSNDSSLSGIRVQGAL